MCKPSSRIYQGQARKSLWIETQSLSEILSFLVVRLVRACGSKQQNLKRQERTSRVRLVRACGSKLHHVPSGSNGGSRVRLVRACGSKQTALKTGYDPVLVRLVRACGSKLKLDMSFNVSAYGQARKSLWIETDGECRLVKCS